MDRDVLLLLLVGGVLLNTGLLVLAAVLRIRQGRERGGLGRILAAPAPAAVIPRQTLPTGPTRTRRAHPSSSGVAAGPARGEALPSRTTAAAAPGDVTESPAAPRPVPEAPTATMALAEPPTPAPPAPRPAAAPAARPAPARRSGRPRRFTMPDLEEDHDRATRSIAAFLGEPVARTPGAHPQRRRHRARRPPGAAVHSDIVLVIGGDHGGGRVAHAVAGALRDMVRASDEVVELPGGRVRVTLEADPAGTEAFVARARAVVRPWLDLLAPGLDLRVEGGPEPERAAPAAS